MDDNELSRLRREIDSIDDAIHDLIMRRVALADHVRTAKDGDGPAFRPAREAQILRRLVERHRGPFPKAVLVHIWREIISATLRLQGPFSVAAYVPEGPKSWYDLAREHFGYATPITAHQSTRSVVHAVGMGSATVGVVPLPDENEADPWWPMLLAYSDSGPSVVARLPVAPAMERRGEWPEALVLGVRDQEASGQDRSFLIVHASADVSRARLGGALAASDMEPVYMITRADEDDPSMTQFLIETNGFVGAGDERIGRLVEAEGTPISEARAIGGYALPFTQSELGADAAADRERRP